MPRKSPAKQPKSKPLTKSPAVPKTMKGQYAIAYWKRITAELVAVEGITTLHLEALEALCIQWNAFKEFDDWIKKNPAQLIIESGKNGHLVEHPAVRLRQQAYDNLTKLWPKFGLTPEGQVKLGRGNRSLGSSSTGSAANAVEDFAAQKGKN